MSKLSAKQKILNTLTKGNKLTVAQARARFGIKNVHARIFDLRQDGHDIQTLSVKRKGVTHGVFMLTAQKATSRKTQVAA